MHEIDGIEVLSQARQGHLPPEVILLTGYGSLETAVAALRSGAFNYLLKPCKSTDLLECIAVAVAQNVVKRRREAAMRVLVQDLAPFQDHAEITPRKPPVNESEASPHNQRQAGEARHIRVGALVLDLYTRSATYDSRQMHLTPIEFTLLNCLAETPGRVVNCQDLVRRTHGYDTSETEAQVLLRTHVRNIRRKIPAEYLTTVRSTGYMLIDPTNTPTSS
jgi:DNA-binding response OmpR family regulator